MQKKARIFPVMIIALCIILILSCSTTTTPRLKSRIDSIPPGMVKVTPATDTLPPKLMSSEFNPPVPMEAAINTAGAEDSALILPDGNTM